MITAKTNENNASYSALFEEAFKYLAANVSSIKNEARREAVQDLGYNLTVRLEFQELLYKRQV